MTTPRNIPEDFSDTEINRMIDDGAPEPGPLTKLFRGMGFDDKLPPIPSVKPVSIVPVRISIPVSRETDESAVCPTCRLFEIESGSEWCPRCTRIAANRAVAAQRQREHDDAVRREINTHTAYIQDEAYAMNYEYARGDVLPICYYHLGFRIDDLTDDIKDDLLADAYEQERENAVDHGNDDGR